MKRALLVLSIFASRAWAQTPVPGQDDPGGGMAPPPPEAVPPPPEAVPPPPLVPAAPPGVVVRLNTTDRRVRLFRHGVDLEGRPARLEVCAAPCDLALDPRWQYVVGGRGLNPSKPFGLPLASQANLTVRTGAKGLEVAGIVTQAGGTVAFVAGVSGIAVTGIVHIFIAALSTGGYNGSDLVSPYLITGAIALAGLGGIIAGLLQRGFATTRVTVTPGGAPAAKLRFDGQRLALAW